MTPHHTDYHAPQRTPRFRRTPTKHIQLTGRDMTILQQVFTHRFLRSHHIIALLGDSPQPLLRRLHLLFHHGYLDRPRDQLFLWTQGSQPLVYGLGNKGADVLSLFCDIPREHVDWTAKNREVTQRFLAHTLLVADVMVSVEVACQQHGGVRLVTSDEIIQNASEQTQHTTNPLSWRVSIRDDHKESTAHIGMVPDKLFGLEFQTASQASKTAYFFLEADRATMPVLRKNFRQTSCYKKMVGYYATWRQHLHNDIFNINNFRVLLVTTSQDRIHHLIKANKQLNYGQGSRLFVFTESNHLNNRTLLERDWINGKEELVRLIE